MWASSRADLGRSARPNLPVNGAPRQHGGRSHRIWARADLDPSRYGRPQLPANAFSSSMAACCRAPICHTDRPKYRVRRCPRSLTACADRIPVHVRPSSRLPSPLSPVARASCAADRNRARHCVSRGCTSVATCRYETTSRTSVASASLTTTSLVTVVTA